MSERPKAILEQIFDGKTARVLDHLSTMRPFYFTVKELSKILDISPEELYKILKHLISYHLIQSEIRKGIDDRTYQLSDNKKTKALTKLLYEIMMDFLDYHSKTKEDEGKDA